MNKKEAAEYLGVSERAIERYTKSGKLHPTLLKRAVGGQIAEYADGEVERLRAAMRSPVTTLARRGDTATSRRADTTTALVRRTSRAEAAPVVPLAERMLLTYAEGSALSGAGVTYIEEAVAAGKLKAFRLGHRSSWVVRRADLEAWIKKM